jgi:hypothetical protein
MATQTDAPDRSVPHLAPLVPILRLSEPVAGVVAVAGEVDIDTAPLFEDRLLGLAGSIWLLGAIGQLPRVRASTKGEGHERRYFYGSVWAVCWAQPALWLMWKVVPKTTIGDTIKLVVFVAILAFVGNLARLGRLPRTRPIVPGELAVSD